MNFKTGAYPDKLDLRDYRYEVVAGSAPIPEKYSLRDKIAKIKHQGSSKSCTGQAYAYYAQVLNAIETGIVKELSARDIYSLIHLEQGGAYLIDAAKKLKENGVVPERLAISYINGNPPHEAFMRQRNDITKEAEAKGMDYLIKSYFRIPVNFESIKRAIYEGHGIVLGVYGDNAGWKRETAEHGYVKIPKNRDWAHAIYCCGYSKDYIEFVDSKGKDWGDNGFGYLGKDYLPYMFDPRTLIDLPNETYQNLLKKKHLLERLVLLYKALIEFLKKQQAIA